jgi:hypothetical protein
MNMERSIKHSMLSAFILLLLCIQAAASIVEESPSDKYYIFKRLNSYIEQECQNNINIPAKIREPIKSTTLKAHQMMSHGLVGSTIYLVQGDLMAPLSFNMLNSHPEFIDQILGGESCYRPQEGRPLYTHFNFFDKKGSILPIDWVNITNIVINLAVNDLHLPILRKTHITRYILKESARNVLTLPKNDNSLIYAHHIAGLLYYYDYISLAISYLYNPKTFLKNFEDIYLYLTSKSYIQNRPELEAISNVYGLSFPKTIPSVKYLLEREGLGSQHLRDVLAFKLARKAKLSHLWSLKNLGEDIDGMLCVSKWEELIQICFKDPFLMSQTLGISNAQEMKDNLNLFLALPFRDRTNHLQMIDESYQLNHDISNIFKLLKPLLHVPISKWRELHLYVKPFISSSTDFVKKYEMVNAFGKIDYKDWQTFSATCMQFSQRDILLDQADAMTILSTLSSYRWQQFITYVRHLVPQNINTSCRLLSTKLLAQLSEEELQSIIRLVDRLAPFEDEMDKVKIIQAIAQVQPSNRNEFMSFIERYSLQNVQCILSLSKELL